MQVIRHTLFDSEVLRVGHVLTRPSPLESSEVERQSLNILVLPLAGVFAKHDGPRRHVIATANHAVFISAGSPYRISYPARIGDRALTLRFCASALARMMPEAMSRDGFDSSAFASHALLPPRTMLARSLLWRRFAHGESDPLEVEELAVGLLASALQAARKEPRARDRGLPRPSSARRRRQVEHVKEAISLQPQRKWTLGELAGLSHASPYHLAHVFREEVGTSPYSYVLRSRLATALDLVLETDADLTSIALETGFASHSHFTARFRDLYGLPPVELRRGTSRGKLSQLRKIVTAGPAAAA